MEQSSPIRWEHFWKLPLQTCNNYFPQNSKCIHEWRMFSKKQAMGRMRKLFPRDNECHLVPNSSPTTRTAESSLLRASEKDYQKNYQKSSQQSYIKGKSMSSIPAKKHSLLTINKNTVTTLHPSDDKSTPGMPQSSFFLNCTIPMVKSRANWSTCQFFLDFIRVHILFLLFPTRSCQAAE